MKKASTRGHKCPTCGRYSMRRAIRKVAVRVGRSRLEVPRIPVEECGHCGERLYDLAALHALREWRDLHGRHTAA